MKDGMNDNKNEATSSQNYRNEAISSRSIREALVEASSFLVEQGVADGRSDAELLMQHMLGWERSRLLLDWHELFPGKYLEEWFELLSRRGTGEPVQYMLGEQEFYGLRFEVTPAGLIPRPETELLVDAIMKRGREIWGNRTATSQGPLVVDIGTGSGAIATSLAVFNPDWQIIACDLSPRAIEVASRNVRKNDVGDRITFHQGDLLEPVIKLGIRVDILVSNPPYIPSSDIEGLQREVREHEPVLALDGGDDGLFCYRRMLAQMERLPSVPSLIGFEVGFGQAQDVAKLMKNCGWWKRVEIILDYSGIERHVIGLID